MKTQYKFVVSKNAENFSELINEYGERGYIISPVQGSYDITGSIYLYMILMVRYDDTLKNSTKDLI